MGPHPSHSRGKVDLRVPSSLHLTALIITLLDWKDSCLLRIVNTNRHRITRLIILRLVVNLPHEHSFCRDATLCQSAISRDACECPCRPRSRTPSQCIRTLCNKVRMGPSYICCWALDGFFGSSLFSLAPRAILCNSKHLAIYRVHESLAPSHDPRRNSVLLLLLSRTRSSRRHRLPRDGLPRIQVC